MDIFQQLVFQAGYLAYKTSKNGRFWGKTHGRFFLFFWCLFQSGVEHFSGSSQPESPECPYLLTTTSFPSELSEMEDDKTEDSESDAFSM